MRQIFEHYHSAPKDARDQQAVIMEKARYARLDILKRFFRVKAQEAGVDYMTIADMLDTAPEIALGKTSGGAEVNKKQKFEYAVLSLANSAAFSFQLVGLQEAELQPKITLIADAAKAGLGVALIKQESERLKDTQPEVAHILECLFEYLNQPTK